MKENVTALESLLAFWADSGVDALFETAPVNRLSTEPGLSASASMHAGSQPPSSRVMAQASATLPVDLDQARDLAAAAHDLAALAAAISAFDGCALKFSGARQSVFARGATDAPVMIIGEAPGADEDLQGFPFVGRAGQLLDRMLAAAGLADRVYITNTVFWRPPGNRTPTGSEQLVCRPFLERAIELIRPKYLLLVGGAAAKAMLDQSDGILSLRGRWLEWKASSGDLEIPALPTLHPAFLLRQPGAKKMAWRDFLTLAARLDRPTRPDEALDA